MSAGWYLGVAFVVMQVVEVVIPYSGLPERVGSVVLILLVAGFPIAMVLSWVFEVTPPRLRRELPPPAPAGGPTHYVPKALRRDSIVVLPFENLSDDPENAYFSDGITDDIISSVAHIQGLRGLSRAASMSFKGVNRRVSEIGAELGVATVVVGSVRRSGSRVRVMAEVVDARSEEHLWTHTYDREVEDIFRVQSEIASEVARAIQFELSTTDIRRIEARGTEDPEAYELYLRARLLWNQRSETAMSESVRYFQRALERDSGFALAYAGLADAHTVSGIYGVRAPEEAFGAARKAAEAALKIDPQLGEATAAMACVHAIYDWKWDIAESGFLKAVTRAPSYPTAHQWYSVNLLVPRGRFDDAREQLERARRLDPISAAIAISEGVVTFYSGDVESATTEFEALLHQYPEVALVRLFLGQCYELGGDLPRSVESLESAVTLAEESSETLAALGHALGRAGRIDEAEGILARLENRSDVRYVSSALVAQVHIGLGRTESALDHLERAADERATDLIWLGVRPVYDAVRDSPRFRAIVERLGLD